MRALNMLGAATLCLAFASPATAASLRITVTNLAETGGFSFTPVYTAFHNGSVDLFDEGASASAGIEEIAELGSFGTLTGERLAIQPNSQGAVATAGAPPTIDPGESGVFEIDILDPSLNRFFSFFSMIVPTNDTFFGNDDAMAFELFDSAGSFLGPKTINIDGSLVFDAGTEANDFGNGPAFVVGVDATEGLATSDFITLSSGVGLETIPPGGISTPAGAFSAAAASIAGLIGTIRIEQVATPVPLPASAFLLIAALGALGAAGARRRAG